MAIAIVASAVAPAEGSIPRRLDDMRLQTALAAPARPVATTSYPTAGYRLLGHPRASAGYGLLPRVRPRASVATYAETRVRSFNFLAWKQRLGNKELSLDLAVDVPVFRNRWYDPETANFTTPDPLGFVDGPSRYQAFGYDPVNNGDPMGLYAEAGHYYTVFYVALRVGYSFADAQQLAFYAQSPDEIARSDAKDNLLDSVTESAKNIFRRSKVSEAKRHMYLNHPSIHALSGTNSHDETDRAVQAFLAAPSAAAAGIQLHRLGDSFAHRRIGNELSLYKAGLGHGGDGTSPDIIQRRPALYLDYVRTLADALADRLGVTAPLGIAGSLAQMARTPVSDQDRWYKNRLAENAALEGNSIDTIRGMILEFGRRTGQAGVAAQALRYRPEATGATGRSAQELLFHFSQATGRRIGTGTGYSADSFDSAFSYAYRVYRQRRGGNP